MSRRLECPWKSEADMCRTFMDACRRAGHRVFPEFSGVDMYVVLADGTRVAVEAKLRPNVEVIAQAMGAAGADFNAVLVPHRSAAFNSVASACKVLPLSCGRMFAWEQDTALLGDRTVSLMCSRLRSVEDWYRRPVKRYPELPPAEPLDMVAGAPAPKQLTKWKLAACSLCLRAEQNGGLVTLDDFRAAGVNVKLWQTHGWIDRVSLERKAGGKTVTTYRLIDKPGAPHIKYPEVMSMLRTAPVSATNQV